MKKTQQNKTLYAFAALLFAVVLIAAGCGANETVLQSGGHDTPSNTIVQNEQTTFESDLEAMHTAGFDFIYALRRRDGAVLNADDVSTIKSLTAETNRRVRSDGDRAILIGSNFQLEPKNIAALDEHFSVEDYSPPPAENANTNANANSGK